jgi:predicted transposase YbfD/YdcC
MASSKFYGEVAFQVQRIAASNTLPELPEFRSLIRVRRQRTIGEKTSDEYHYYISSLPADNASKLMEYVRGHWGVENNLHWCLDISFADDQRRAREGNAAENFARLGRTHTAALERKPTKAMLAPAYLLGVEPNTSLDFRPILHRPGVMLGMC